MLRYTLVKDPDGQEFLETELKGKALLESAKLNKGCAFTHEERINFDLIGRLPYRAETLEEQVTRHYLQFQRKNTNLGRNVYLNALHDNNETLFYKLVSEHLVEMLPIIYTPTIGEAVEKFSHELRRPRGLYVSYPDREHMDALLDNRANSEIDLIVVTDGEGVLGIGDQGVGGIDICIAKLMVYTLCAGVNPHRVLPIQLDVGTNNPILLNDPMYLGWRNRRITGQDYDDFIDQFVKTVQRKFPNVYLHWEDFGRDNARKNLERYRPEMCTFNDDMQGTGATALACVLSALTATNSKLTEQRIVVYGAGTAGVGITDQICALMCEQGLSEAEARARFWLIDRSGLLTQNSVDLADFQAPYARNPAEVASWTLNNTPRIELLDVVQNIKPTILIGCSTVSGAFNEQVVKAMAAEVDRPIILPLSNPTTKSEAHPHDLLTWTNGRALIAAGSPFGMVEFNGKKNRIAQSNNAYVFPGLGLGIIAAQATRCTDGMIQAACLALSACSPVRTDPTAPILPQLEELPSISGGIALAVAEQARREGVAGIPNTVDLKERIKSLQWKPKYYPYRRRR